MATVYFAGGEDTSFAVTGSYAPSTSANTFRSAFSRCSMAVTAVAPSAADPPTSRITTPAFSAVSTLWIHGVLGYGSSNNGNVSNATLMRALDAGVARIVVRGTGTAGQVKIDTRNAAGTFVNLVTSAAGAIPAILGTNTFDLFINYSTTGQCTLYVNGVNVADTGPSVDVTTNGATTLNQVDYANMGPNAASVFGWSECVVQDSSTLGVALWTIPPVAAGNTQSWTPNTVGNINEITINDATLVSTASNNALSQWTTSTSPPSGIWALEAVVQNARISRGASGPQNFEFSCRTADGTDHVQGSTAPTTSLANYATIWTLNPHTSAAWDIADIATGFNLGVESLA